MPPRFLYYLLRTLRLDLLDRATAVPGLNREDAYAVTLGLPPLEEQTRIANKLDTLFTRVDACLERLDRLRAILDRLRQAVLVAATNGELTREWRDERGVARAGWRSVTFQDVCSEITVGFVGKMADQYLSSGVPFLRSQNVRPFKFDPRELRFISPEFHRSIAKSTLRPGDVVVVRTGAPGQCCVVPNELSEANCSDLVIVRPGPELDPEFAVVFINSETSQAFVKAEQVGVAQSHFNVGSMKRSPIDLPSLPEQREIARRVREIFDLAASLDERVRAARQSAAGLNSGVLAKAFRGELVPQDPTDEPATSLLASLRARHEEAPRTGRSRKANRP
jgi:type I restriction enzyme S subunit